jgi:hypothetical protein
MRVPPHVIDVQVGADDEIYCLSREFGRRQVREEGVLLIELRDQRAILRVAGTCVNDDAKIFGLDNEGLEAHQVVLAAGIDEVGLEPRLGGNVCGRGFDPTAPEPVINDVAFRSPAALPVEFTPA